MTTHDNSNNGLMTKIWGPHMWMAIHTITFGYPIKPDEETKQRYKTFFETLGYVLPCKFCRDSYLGFIKEPEYKLTDEVLSSRENLTHWAYKIHERVNKKLDVDYGVSFDDVKEKFEAFRAKCVPLDEFGVKATGCNMPLDVKAQSFRMAKKKDCPIVEYDIAEEFIKYAKQRGITDFEKIKYYREISKDRDSKEWENRNKECTEIINEMRDKGYPALEKDGSYEGLPTVHELKLIMRICTTLPKSELRQVAERIKNMNKNLQNGGRGDYRIKKYRLSKEYQDFINNIKEVDISLDGVFFN